MAAIIDSAGNLVVEYKYDAWGNITHMFGSLASTLGEMNPFRYRGYVYDVESGLYYLRSRYYNPEWGRFINADTVLNSQALLGLNCFAYCLNNPVHFTDSSGCVPSKPQPTRPDNWAAAYYAEQRRKKVQAFWNCMRQGIRNACIGARTIIHSIGNAMNNVGQFLSVADLHNHGGGAVLLSDGSCAVYFTEDMWRFRPESNFLEIAVDAYITAMGANEMISATVLFDTFSIGQAISLLGAINTADELTYAAEIGIINACIDHEDSIGWIMVVSYNQATYFHIPWGFWNSYPLFWFGKIEAVIPFN